MNTPGERPTLGAAPPGRLRRLIIAGLIDSLGLSLGWTVFNLHAVAVHGLATVGFFGAAMLTGVALSAPVAGRLAVRVPGRLLLRGTAVVEALLRLVTFSMLIVNAPLVIIAAAIVLMNVVSWTAYAGMRAEVAAVDSRASAMTWYAVAILSIEAVGAAAAAALPATGKGVVGGGLLIGVAALYAGSLLPQFLVARGSRVARAPRLPRASAARRRLLPLGGAAAIMLLGSGPTLLVVGLAAELHGRRSVAAAAVAFTVGTLMAPAFATVVERRRVPASVSWPLLGAGMVAGWIAAPWSLGGLVTAQVLSGLSMGAFEGMVDARVAADSDTPGGATAGLAWTAAARALGSAAAVGGTPAIIATTGLARLSGGAALALTAMAVIGVLSCLARQTAAAHPAAEMPTPRA